MFKFLATKIAHNTTIPALAGNSPLQDLITAEKAVLVSCVRVLPFPTWLLIPPLFNPDYRNWGPTSPKRMMLFGFGVKERGMILVYVLI